LQRDGAVLLVASRYPNLPEALWHLPGGRPTREELLGAALEREYREETGLAVAIGPLLYASESFDGATGTHVLNLTFEVHADGTPRIPQSDAHVVDVAWVPRDELAARIRARVVREPLLAALSGDPRRYFAFPEAGISVQFAD
jgi:ADP-ribose pyrophosphatase YjhB (NUDIX family)